MYSRYIWGNSLHALLARLKYRSFEGKANFCRSRFWDPCLRHKKWRRKITAFDRQRMMPALIELAAVDSGGGGVGTLVPANKRGPSTESMAAGCSSPYIRQTPGPRCTTTYCSASFLVPSSTGQVTVCMYGWCHCVIASSSLLALGWRTVGSSQSFRGGGVA